MKSRKLIFVSLFMAIMVAFGLVGCAPSTPDDSLDDNNNNDNNDNTVEENPDEEDPFKYADYLINHAENQQVTYVFEAECTDLGSKSGPAWSGSYTEAAMIVQAEGASGGYAVQGLGKYGNTVNFLVVCDRDVEDAELILQLGNTTKYEMSLNSNNYAVRVDTIVTDDDLKTAADGGAIGNWDEFFLQYYTDLAQTGGYYISSWECGNIEFEAPSPFTAGNVYMGDADGYKITSSLKLKKGVNCISLITANNETIVGTTMTATAPAVDCIEISTTAQLGMYYKKDNGGYGVTACKIK